MWFACAIMTALGWGVADIFYKKGADPNEKYSHLKTCIFCGLVFGLHAIFSLLTKNLAYDPINIIKYAPVSLCYIISMFWQRPGLSVPVPASSPFPYMNLDRKAHS